MSNEQTIEALPPEERARLRKQMSDQAVKLAVSSRWDEAVTVNRDYVRVFGEDADALNRLGKALSEVGQVTEARKAYGRSLEIDPTNAIARRNLDRLASMRDSAAAAAAAAGSQLDTRLFVEESGKATVAVLQAVDAAAAALLDAGDLLDLEVQGNAVNVKSKVGGYVGMLEPRIGLRLAKMMTAGNQYTAAVVTASGDVRVMVRETFQHPSQIGRVSFPQSRATDFRAYTRRGLLRGEELEYGEEDEGEEEEPEEAWSERSDDLDHTGVEVDIEAEDESFD
ncbi:MAG: tetratricopeptide repeat protein [Dehalococcoidia bacterium]|nr:tetratricopeptide repeat protein [Dehalococcoidia bacterium]